MSGASSRGALGAPTPGPLRLPAGARQPGVPATDPRLRGLVPRGRDELRRGGVARHRARAGGDRGAVGRRRGGRVFLGAIPLAWLAGLLTLPLYVVLLAVSSLLHAWGSAGKYTLLAELLPAEQRLAANTLVSSLNFAATIAGPAIAGVLVTYGSSALVLGLDALSYVFLAVLVARMRLPASGPVSVVDQAAARGGLTLLRSHPELLGLLTLTWFFNLLYGPVEVALPLHVTDDLHAPGTLLGLYWMLFGIGAVLGGLAVGALRQLPLWPVTVVIVVGWGLSLLPFGFDVPTAVTVACFTLGGAIYGPFVALSVTLMQAKSPPQHLAAMLAARSMERPAPFRFIVVDLIRGSSTLGWMEPLPEVAGRHDQDAVTDLGGTR